MAHSLRTNGDLLDELAARLNEDRSETDVQTRYQRALNTAWLDFGSKGPWRWREREWTFPTVMNYTTGTVAVTQGSRTVTGTGTAWDSTMEGRWFRVDGMVDWYRVVKVVSATSLTLDQVYIAATATGKTYIIWKRLYDLATDCDAIKAIVPTNRYRPLRRRGVHWMETRAAAQSQGWPTAYAEFGIDRVGHTYSTGTITGTVDTRTLTGSGTSWVGNVDPGDALVVGANTYEVERVNSDTSITLYQNLRVAIAAGTSYTFTGTDQVTIQLDGTPSPAILMRLLYLKRVYPMLHDSDVCEADENGRRILILKAEAILLKQADDDSWVTKQQEYDAEIKKELKILEAQNADESGFYRDEEPT